jgi:hypothetical protein
VTSIRRAGLALAFAAFAVLLFKHISYPLLWQDEAETAMFATRILEYGYPRVHGPGNVLYEFGNDTEIGIKEGIDAYIGTTWGHFYAAVPALLWSRGAGDLHAQTARLRIPFAALGLLGLLCFVGAATPAFGGDRRRAELFAALFFALSCFSVSLILHLRELRYYPLQVALGGAILAVYLRHQIHGVLGYRAYVLGLSGLLVLLFNVFYSGYLAFSLLLGLHAAYLGWRAAGDLRARCAVAARGLAPLALSALALIPGFLFFETFTIAARFSATMGFDAGVYRTNLATIGGHLWRHELLTAALAVRLAAAALGRTEGGAGARRDPRHRTAAFLVGFAAGYVLLVCVNPLCYERYFLVLSPVLTAAFLLDAFGLVERLPLRFAPERRRRAAVAVAVALGVLLAATGRQRAEDLSERLYEITHRLEGPVDLLVAHLRDRYPRPEELVIATNYEAHPLMFYLGSRVIVGFSRNNIEVDRGLEPDVVVPRRTWKKTLGELRPFLRRAHFRRARLPISDTPYNNIPALTKTPRIPMVHRFRTAWSPDRREQLILYHRVREESASESADRPG